MISLTSKEHSHPKAFDGHDEGDSGGECQDAMIPVGFDEVAIRIARIEKRNILLEKQPVTEEGLGASQQRPVEDTPEEEDKWPTVKGREN